MTQLLRNRRAKIVATLGLASSSYEMIEALFFAGADIFRLNFSHGTINTHKQNVAYIREIEKKHNIPLTILADLQGPKLRIGKIAKSTIALEKDQEFILDQINKPGDETRVYLPHAQVFTRIKPGMRVLLNDGNIALKVIKTTKKQIITIVENKGTLSSHKGFNIPDMYVPISAITEKDQQDISHILDMPIDWLALSFVQSADDMALLRKLTNNKISLIAKIERPQAIENLDAILELSDGLMVARGDLGVELSPEVIPSIQKHIIGYARAFGKPTIVATQMLESMITNPTPTRAEASDVATAIYDGADAVMLSGETAIGAYPVEAVSMMNRIIEKTELDPIYWSMQQESLKEHLPIPETDEALSQAAARLASELNAACLVTYTTSGSTTIRAAKMRPKTAILSLTPKLNVARKLNLIWGVHPIHTKDTDDLEHMVAHAQTAALESGYGKQGDCLVITAGIPFGTPGSTNLLRIAWV